MWWIVFLVFLVGVIVGLLGGRALSMREIKAAHSEAKRLRQDRRRVRVNVERELKFLQEVLDEYAK